MKASARIATPPAACGGTGAALTVALCLVFAVCAARADPPAGSVRAADAGALVATLSDFKTLSRWAYPQAAADVHRDPSERSPVIARLQFLTSDGQAQVYLTLRSYTIGSVTWISVSVPGRPNGRSGWVPAEALGEMHVSDEYLRVNRRTLRATLYRGGRPIWGAPVGVGRPGLPTPAGRFYVTEKLAAMGGAFYGPYALGTSAYAPTLSDWPGGGVVGIHGTDEPELIPGRPSHGCMRLRNADITRLWPLIRVGTPIEIV